MTTLLGALLEVGGGALGLALLVLAVLAADKRWGDQWE